MTNREWTAEELMTWFDMEAPRIVAEAEARARSSVTEVPFFGPVFYPRSKDLPAGEDLPDDLPEFLAGYVYPDDEAAIVAGMDAASAEVGAIWVQARIAASVYWHAAQERRMRGKSLRGLKSEVARKLAGAWFQAGDGKDGGYKTLTRRIDMGITFPDRVVHLDKPAALYLVALETDDPIGAIEAALANEWKASELKEHIETGDVPDIKEVLLDATFAPGDDLEDVLQQVADAWHSAHNLKLGPHKSVKVRLVSTWAGYDASEAEKEAA